MRRWIAAAAIGIASVGSSQLARAQAGSFVGIVARDTLDHGIANAEVRLPQLDRLATTNDSGTFEIPDIPAGRYAVVVRAIGFQQLIAEIEVKAGQRLDA
jgi:hypothetical protein